MDNKTMWALAAKNGLVLSCITVVTVLLATYVTLPSWASMSLTVAKFVAIGYVLHYFMKQYSEELDIVSYKESFRYGLTICFLSSIVCTVFSTLIFLFSDPETLDTIIGEYMTILESSGVGAEMDFDSMKGMILKIMPPVFLVWYMIFGLIYSSIIANFTKKEETFPTSEDI